MKGAEHVKYLDRKAHPTEHIWAEPRRSDRHDAGRPAGRHERGHGYAAAFSEPPSTGPERMVHRTSGGGHTRVPLRPEGRADLRGTADGDHPQYQCAEEGLCRSADPAPAGTCRFHCPASLSRVSGCFRGRSLFRTPDGTALHRGRRAAAGA